MHMKKIVSVLWGIIDKTARQIVDFLLKLIGKSITDGQWAAFMQFVKFGMVGAMNTVVDYVVYLIALWLFTKAGLFGENAYLVASVVGFIVSFMNMFYWNNKYVFKQKEGEERSAVLSFIKLFASYGITGLIIKPVCLKIFVGFLHVPEAIAPIPIMLITIPLNFILSKLWAFRGKKKTE